MKIRILGSAAGGGFPQWNCNCFNCRGVRDGTIRATARTQSSIAVSENGTDWVLVNASPDILAQIRATPALQPARALRDSGICAVLLMDAQVDHVTGLLMLRERSSPLPLYATADVLADLSGALPLTAVLGHFCGVERHPVRPDGSEFAIPPLANTAFTAVPLSSKAPPYSPHRNDPHPGDNIGLLITSRTSGRRAFYAPGLGAVDARVLGAMTAADVLLVDGTFWSEDEMQMLGLSSRPAAAMGHLPQSGPGGMIELLAGLPERAGQPRRKILIHINNSNPILREDSAERAELTAHGIELAWDGMEIDLVSIDLEPAWSRAEFEEQLRARGRGYHIHHPFNVRLNAGRCTPAQVRCWIANRFYYQWIIPKKDAAILSNCDDRATRRLWIARILDHDGYGEYDGDAAGGLEAWTRLAAAAGIDRDTLWSLRQVVPAVRFACDAYVEFARRAPWQEAVCSSLTELFAPQIHKDRLAGWPVHYPWIAADGLQYFRSRIPLAERDVSHGMAVTLDYFTTRAQQQRALDILQMKLDILWAMLDAIEKACPDDE